MIKVLHIFPGLPVGGAEMMLYKLLAASSAREFRHEVLCMAGRGEMGERISALGVPVHYLDMPLHGLSLAAALSLRCCIRRVAPQIVQGWTYFGNLAACIAQMMFDSSPRMRFIWNIRCSIPAGGMLKRKTRAVAWLLPRLPWAPAAIINNSRRSAREHAALGYPLQRTVVIPNGFDCERFRPHSNAGSRLRILLGVAPATLVVGMVGRYDAAKDYGNFIRAAGLAGRQIPVLHCVLIGKDVDDGNRELTDSIARAGMSGRIHLLGLRNDIAELVAGVDVFCLSSSTEGFANVVGEAMACAVPCVVTDAGDCGWLVDDTGIVVPTQDAAALSDGLIRMLRLLPEERGRLGERGRRRIAENFSLTTVRQRYEDLYLELLAGGRVSFEQ